MPPHNTDPLVDDDSQQKNADNIAHVCVRAHIRQGLYKQTQGLART